MDIIVRMVPFSDNGKRLIAYGKNSNADLSGITSANPYAFRTEEQLETVKENCNMPDSIIKQFHSHFIVENPTEVSSRQDISILMERRHIVTIMEN